MASRLPIAQQASLSGQRQQAAIVAPTDLGLSGIADGIDKLNAVEDRRATDAAKRALVAADGAYEADFATASAAYDGMDPDFAGKMTSAYDAKAAEARAGLGQREQAAFDRLNVDNRANRAAGAVTHQGARQAGIIADQVAAEQRGRVGLASTTFMIDTMKAREADNVSGAVSQDGYIEQSLSAFDARAKTAIDAATEADRPALQSAIQGQRQNTQLSLYAQDLTLREGRIKTAARQGITALENEVMSGRMTPEAAMAQTDGLLSGLPVDQRDAVKAALPAQIYGAHAQGLLARGEDNQLEAMLNDPAMKKLMGEGYGRMSSIVQQRKAAGVRAVKQDTVDKAMASEIMSLTQTGQSTGFNPASIVDAYDGAQAPLIQRKYAEARAQAMQDHQLVTQADVLSQPDYLKLIESYKPEPGAADYAVAQQRYERMYSAGAALITARSADPAGAMARSAQYKALYAAMKAGDPSAPAKWANAAVAQQALWFNGDKNAVKIVPVDLAKGWTNEIAKAPPEQRDEVMGRITAQINAFGAQYTGRALKELQAAGLPGQDAAVMFLADGDPVLLGNYSRAAEGSKLWKGSKEEVTSLSDKVRQNLSAFTASYGSETDAKIFGDNALNAAITMAKSLKADGLSEGDAARQASGLMMRGWVVDERSGLRLPSSVASRGNIEIVPLNNPHAKAKVKTDGMTAVRQGLYALKRDYGLYDTEQLYNAGQDVVPSPGGARKRLAARVLEDGFFMTTPDGKSARLVIATVDRGVTSVLDKSGRPIIRSWDEIIARAGQPANRPRDKGARP